VSSDPRFLSLPTYSHADVTRIIIRGCLNEKLSSKDTHSRKSIGKSEYKFIRESRPTAFTRTKQYCTVNTDVALLGYRINL